MGIKGVQFRSANVSYKFSQDRPNFFFKLIFLGRKKAINLKTLLKKNTYIYISSIYTNKFQNNLMSYVGDISS